ncbi:hypothetical protein, partial [Miniimonas arenae]|uniref:hypothetical protein n=1 Tax=Miniimonas arenae TaxID=676201 RepID=UPI0028AEFC36
MGRVLPGAVGEDDSDVSDVAPSSRVSPLGRVLSEAFRAAVSDVASSNRFSRLGRVLSEAFRAAVSDVAS